MEEQELRSYLLTAVASHASKEMRRRSRKPVNPLESEREQVVTDGHMPLPDELAIGNETRAVARDLLTSLPVRRRAVMLLRYGWGLSPQEVCALVPGLSPRAYRKEITRGVEDLIRGLGKVESGEWCAEREDLVRDLIAGTAGEAARRQALRHLEHCRACSELAAQISGHLREAGSLIAFGAVSGCIGGTQLSLASRIGDAVTGFRTAASSAADRAETAATSLAASGGAKGSGAAGAGALAKLAGVGGTAKSVIACLGAGAAATACVAAGVVPGIAIPDRDSSRDRPAVARGLERASEVRRGARTTIASVVAASREAGEEGVGKDPDPAAAGDNGPAQPAPETVPEVAPQDVAQPPAVQEFDPVAASAPTNSAAPPAGSTRGKSGSTGSTAQDEFGP